MSGDPAALAAARSQAAETKRTLEVARADYTEARRDARQLRSDVCSRQACLRAMHFIHAKFSNGFNLRDSSDIERSILADAGGGVSAIEAAIVTTFTLSMIMAPEKLDALSSAAADYGKEAEELIEAADYAAGVEKEARDRLSVAGQAAARAAHELKRLKRLAE